MELSNCKALTALVREAASEADDLPCKEETGATCQLCLKLQRIAVNCLTFTHLPRIFCENGK